MMEIKRKKISGRISLTCERKGENLSKVEKKWREPIFRRVPWRKSKELFSKRIQMAEKYVEEKWRNFWRKSKEELKKSWERIVEYQEKV